jgi:hypothetical protein
VGLIGKVLKVAFNDFIEITSNVLAPKYDRVARYTGTPGIVGIPLKDDDSIIIQIGDDLSKLVFIGTLQNQEVGEGEILIYSRDSDGNVAAKVYCDKDGNVIINDDSDNAVRFSELKSGFDTLKDDFNNFISTAYNVHVHSGVTPGPSSTGPTLNVGSSTAASVDNSKIEEIKVP